MDNQTRKPEASDGGLVKIVGGTAPNEFPHVCPYQPAGAARTFCADMTSNFQRNKGGCCGTADYRSFAPCNSVLRKCLVCLLDGKGANARTVVDVRRGLCAEHKEAADAAAPAPSPVLQPRRYAVQSDIPIRTTRKPRPEWAKPAPVAAKGPTEPEVSKPALVRSVEVNPGPKPAAPPKDALPAPPPGELLTQHQIKEMAARVSRLGRREMQVIVELLDQSYEVVAQKLGLHTSAVVTYMHSACRRLGIPRSNRFVAYDRLGAVRLVVARYKQLATKGS